MTQIDEVSSESAATENDLFIQSPPRGGLAGWIGPLAATVLGAILRLPHLGSPHALVFDETYYAKDALSLLKFGYERQTIEGADAKLLSGNLDIFKPSAEYVVHPPLGKWIIAFGEHLFGANPFGWRIMVAMLGIASILITARVARRLTHSNVVGTTAGMLLALDGLHIAMSRTALLDTPLSFFVISAFACLIIDRDHMAQRGSDDKSIRWPRIAMAILLGCAVATKWSGLYFAGAFVALMLYWDWQARHKSNDERATTRWIVRDLLRALFVPIAMLAIYLASWIGWFRTDGGWNREWASKSHLPQALAALLHYHHDMYEFHTHLTTPHNYKANPLGWPLMLRPTSFFYETAPTCGGTSCSQEVIPLVNDPDLACAS